MPGKAWHGRSATLPPTSEDADPADGAKVPRCKKCGLPTTPLQRCVVCDKPNRGGELLEFALVRGKHAVPILLCESCYWAIAPFDPQSGDPLRAEEAS